MPIATLLPSFGPSAPPSALTLSLSDRSAPASEISALLNTKQRTFQSELNDVGSGQFTVRNEDTDWADVLLDRLVTFNVHGNDAWTMLIESMHRVTLHRREEREQVTVVNGRGHLVVTEEATIDPPRGVDVFPVAEDRQFSWPAVAYNDSPWGNAASYGLINATYGIWWPVIDDWPANALNAERIGPASGTFSNAPTGDWYVRKGSAVIPATNDYQISMIMDNSGELHIDEQRILTVSGQNSDLNAFYHAHTVQVTLSAGVHTFAAHINNLVWPTANNPTTFAIAVQAIQPNGDLDPPVLVSDSSWKINEFPSYPPGMTPGEAIRVALEEAQARGALTDVVLAFSDGADSAGTAWPLVGDIATKVGTSYLTFLKELTTTYIDVWMAPRSFTLYAWNKGGRTNYPSVDLHGPTDPTDPTSGTLFELTHSIAV